MVLRGFGKKGNRKRVNGELDFVGGEEEGQPGRVSYGKGAVELCCKYVEVWSKGRSRGCCVGDQEGDGSSLIDLSSDREGEGEVCISEDARGNVWKCSSYQGGLVVFIWGRARNVEPCFRCGERRGGRNLRP